MITMEFEDLKKMWHSQDKAYIYSIDEQALHNRIRAKQRQAYHTAHVSEWLSIGAFVVAGGAILVSSWMKSGGSIYMYLLTAWMLFGALDRKSTRLNSSHVKISYAVFCLKKKKVHGFFYICHNH